MYIDRSGTRTFDTHCKGAPCCFKSDLRGLTALVQTTKIQFHKCPLSTHSGHAEALGTLLENRKA